MIEIREFLSKFESVRQTDDNQWEARCPSHDDNRASLHVAVGDKGIVLDCKAGCKTHDVVWAIDCKMTDLFRDEPKKKSIKARIEKVYQYHNADGSLAFEVVRLRDPKDFRQRKNADQEKWSMKGVTRVLYNLPEVLKAQTVVIAEGEKDADNLREIGIIATCNAGGAAAGESKWLASYNDSLAGKHVVIIPDLDKPDDNGERAGTRHALHVAGQLKSKAASVKIIELPIEEKQDVSDWLANGGTAEELRQIIEATPEYTGQPLVRFGHVAPKTVESRIEEAGGTRFGDDVLDALRLEVLGETEGGRIEVFAIDQRKSDVIRDINRLSKADLLRICGEKAIGVVFAARGEVPPGMFSIDRIRESIAFAAGRRRLSDDAKSGVGIWPGKTEDGVENDSLVFVGAGEAAVLNGKPELQRLEMPRYGGRVLDLSASDGWFEFDALRDFIHDAISVDWRRGVIEASDEIWGRWAWQCDVDPQIITGLILATWVQTTWRWRPQVAITGESSSGKSTLFAALGGSDHRLGVFGRLAIKSSGSTAAGLRQSIVGTAGVLFCDEFDSGRYRREVLEMLRSSGGGDIVLRGSSSQKRMQFRMRHIAWVAGIESGLERDPDRNRFVSLELIKPPKNEMGRLKVPSEAELVDIGFRLLASISGTIRRAKELVNYFRSNPPEGFHLRIVESYAVPAACYAAACGMDDSEALVTFLRFIDRHDDSDAESDTEMLISAIMSSLVDLGRGQRQSVSELVARVAHLDTDEGPALNRCGLAGFAADKRSIGNDYIFFAHNLIKRHLLRGTDWENARIDQILARIPGAQKVKKRISGAHPWGVLAPYDSVVSTGSNDPPTAFVADDDFDPFG